MTLLPSTKTLDCAGWVMPFCGLRHPIAQTRSIRAPRKRGLQHAGSRPTTGVPGSDCGAGRYGVKFIVRPGNRPGYSLTADREGRPRGATTSVTRPRVSLPRETLGACTRVTVLRGWSGPWSRRIPRQRTSRMPGTLIPIASAMLSPSNESVSCMGNPATGNGTQEQQVAPTEPTDRTASATYIAPTTPFGFLPAGNGSSHCYGNADRSVVSAGMGTSIPHFPSERTRPQQQTSRAGSEN